MKISNTLLFLEIYKRLWTPSIQRTWTGTYSRSSWRRSRLPWSHNIQIGKLVEPRTFWWCWTCPLHIAVWNSSGFQQASRSAAEVMGSCLPNETRMENLRTAAQAVEACHPACTRSYWSSRIHTFFRLWGPRAWSTNCGSSFGAEIRKETHFLSSSLILYSSSSILLLAVPSSPTSSSFKDFYWIFLRSAICFWITILETISSLWIRFFSIWFCRYMQGSSSNGPLSSSW